MLGVKSEGVLVSRIWVLGNLHAVSLSTGIKTNLDERIVLVEVRLVQNIGLEVVIDQWLPGGGQTEDIEAINASKVLPAVRRQQRIFDTVLGCIIQSPYIWLLAIAVLGQLYCFSKSLGAKLPWDVSLVQWLSFHGKTALLTLVSIPISQPAMFTPASQTALACVARTETRRERETMVTERGVDIRSAL